MKSGGFDALTGRLQSGSQRLMTFFCQNRPVVSGSRPVAPSQRPVLCPQCFVVPPQRPVVGGPPLVARPQRPGAGSPRPVVLGQRSGAPPQRLVALTGKDGAPCHFWAGRARHSVRAVVANQNAFVGIGGRLQRPARKGLRSLPAASPFATHAPGGQGIARPTRRKTRSGNDWIGAGRELRQICEKKKQSRFVRVFRGVGGCSASPFARPGCRAGRPWRPDEITGSDGIREVGNQDVISAFTFQISAFPISAFYFSARCRQSLLAPLIARSCCSRSMTRRR
jgi:hypothetical protein